MTRLARRNKSRRINLLRKRRRQRFRAWLNESWRELDRAAIQQARKRLQQYANEQVMAGFSA